MKKQKGKTWIFDETFYKIQEKNNAKVKSLQSYKELKHTAQRMLREYKQKQINDMCEKLQEANAKGNKRKLFQQVRSLTSTFKPKLHCVKFAEEEIISETDKIAERWLEYCEDLYKDKDSDSQLKVSDRQPQRTSTIESRNSKSHSSDGKP